MLLFTSGRTRVLRRTPEPTTWLSAAQTAAQSAVQAAQSAAASAAQSVDPAAMLEQAKAEVADVARHIRTTAPEIAEELVSTKPASIRKSVMAVVPMRRRRRSRWPFLLLGALVAAGLLTLASRFLMRRRSMLPMRIEDRWQPSSANGTDGMHPPLGVAPDVTTGPDTLDRDADLRATDEGMEPPSGDVRARSLGAAATSGSDGELPYEPSLQDSPDIEQTTL